VARRSYEAERACCWIMLAWGANRCGREKEFVADPGCMLRTRRLAFCAALLCVARRGWHCGRDLFCPVVLLRDAMWDRESVHGRRSSLRRGIRRANRLTVRVRCGCSRSGVSRMGTISSRAAERVSRVANDECAATNLVDGCAALSSSALELFEEVRRGGRFANNKVCAVPNLIEGCGAPDSNGLESLERIRRHRCFVNNEVSEVTNLVDGCRALGFMGAELFEQIRREGCLARVAGTGVEVSLMEASWFALWCEKSLRHRRAPSVQPESIWRFREVSAKVRLCASGGSSPLSQRDVLAALRERAVSALLRPCDACTPSRLDDAGANASGKGNCVPETDAIVDGDDSIALRKNCGIARSARRSPGNSVPRSVGSIGLSGGAPGGVSEGASGNKSGECSASEGGSKLPALPARRQSRIQRANLASTSASAHLSMISCASFRSIARRFKCESSNDSRASFGVCRGLRAHRARRAETS
jgi:hypothetical protein